MKVLRALLCVFLGFAFFVGVLVALLFVPAVQKALVLRLASTRPGLSLDVDSIRVRPSGIEVYGLDMSWQGARIRAPEAEVRFHGLGMLFGAAPEVVKVRLIDCELDLSSYRAAVSAGESAPEEPVVPPEVPSFPGILPSIALGGLRVDGIDVSLRVVAPASGLAGPAVLRVRGGGVAPDAEGRLRFEVGAPLARSDGESIVVAANGEMRLRRDGSGRAVNAAVEGEFEATGAGLAAPVRAVVAVEVAPREGVEAWRARVGSSLSAPPWLDADLRYSATTQTIRGVLGLDFPEGMLEAWAPRLPVASLQGSLELETRWSGVVAAARGELRIRARELGRALPELAGTESLEALARIDVRAEDRAVTLRAVEAVVALDQQEPSLRVRLERAVRLPLGEGMGVAALEEGPFLRATLDRFPVGLAGFFVPGLVIESGLSSGEMVVSAGPNGLEFRTERSLRVVASSVTLPGRPLLREVEVDVSGDVQWSQSGELRGSAELGLRGQVENLAVVHPGLGAVGALGITVRASAAAQPGSLTVRRFEGTLADGVGAHVAVLTLNAPVTLDPAHPLPPAFQTRTTVATVALDDLPLAWMEPFQSSAARLRGGVARGTVFLDMGPEGIGLRMAERGLDLGPFSLSLDGADAVENVALRLFGEARLRGPEVELDGLRVDARTERGELATLRVDGALRHAQLAGRLRLSLTGRLAELLRQPIAGGNREAVDGRLAVAAEVIVDDDFAAQGSVQLQSVAARTTAGGAVRSVGLEFRARRAGAVWSVSGPLSWESDGRVSALDVSLRVEPTAGGRFESELIGREAYVDDLLALVASLQPPAPASVAAPSRPPVERNGGSVSSAPWGERSGALRLDVDRMVLRGLELREVRVNAALSPEAARLERAGARFAGGTAALEGGIAFDRGSVEPIRLGGRLRLESVDAGELFAALQPGKPPLLDAVVRAFGSVEGRAASLESLLGRLQFGLEVEGGPGTSAALQYGLAELSGGERRGTAGLLRGLAGAAGRVGAAVVTPYLSPLRFDRLSGRVVRGADLDVVVDSLELRGSEVRLSGALRARHVPGAGILDSALEGVVHLAAKGRFAGDLAGIRLLRGAVNAAGEFVPELDELGYARFLEPVRLEGTVGSPGHNLLRILATQAAGRLLERL